MLTERRRDYGDQPLWVDTVRCDGHHPSCRTVRSSSLFVATLSAVHYSRESMNRSHFGRSGHPMATSKTLLSKFAMGLLGVLLAATGVGAEGGVPSRASSNLAVSGRSGSRQQHQAAMALDSAIASSYSRTQRRSNAIGRDSATVTGKTGSYRDSVETCESGSFKNEVDDVHDDDEVGSLVDVRVDETDDGYDNTQDYDTTTEEDSSDYHDSDDPAPPTSSQKEGTKDDVQLGDPPDSVRVCVVTWNLAEVSPPARDVEFIRRVSRESDLVAVGVQEIENLKPRRHEGGRTREWRRLLIRTLGRDFVRVGHHAMGAVQLTLFARREMFDRVKVIKLTEVVCGVGNVLQNKGGIGAFVRVDRTTFLFIGAHLAAHQTRIQERNADYWRIATTLDQEMPPAWVTHAARKRAKRVRLIENAKRQSDTGAAVHATPTTPPEMRLQPRGPFQDHVDRVFFFGDLNYRVDLSREDLELGVAVDSDRESEALGAVGSREQTSKRKGHGVTYPGIGYLDPLLDFDQLTLARSRGDAFGRFSEARVTFRPTYKFDKGSSRYDTSHRMRPPAWTDRILFAPAGPQGVSCLEYDSVPESRHSDHRPVYASFKVRLED